MNPIYEQPDNHFNAFFIGIALNWYHWDVEVVGQQLDPWNKGQREDERLYSDTFQIAALSDKLAKQVG